jgi:hypothetical protein
MAQQGLFTQGPSVSDLLQQRNQRSTDLQQTLMANAAAGARDPMKAQAASLIGSSLGRALAGSMGGEDKQVEAIEARDATQAGLVKEYATAASGTDVSAMYRSANNMIQTGDPTAITMGSSLLQRADQLKTQQANNTNTTAQYAALQQRATTIGQDLSEWNPELSYRLVSGNATPEEYKEGLSEVTAMNKKSNKVGTGNEAKGWQYNDGGIYSDSEGNRYSLTNSINKDKNSADILYTPIGNAPAYTDQPLQPTDTTGLTKDQRVEEKTAVYRGKEDMEVFYEHRGTAGSEIGQTTTNLNDANRMLELLTKVNTGGTAVLVGKAVSDFLGTTPADISELDTISKTVMLGSLKSLLGGQLSDGERAAATEIQVALEKGKEANTRIAKRLSDVFKAKLAREQFVLGNKNTPASYRDFMVQQSIDLTTPDPAAVTKVVIPDVTPKAATMNWKDY